MPVVFDFSRWQQVQNEAAFLGVNMNLHLQPLCHKACDSFNCFALAGLLLGLRNHVLSGLGPQVLQQTGPDLHMVKADLSTSGIFNQIWQQPLNSGFSFCPWKPIYLPQKLLE